MQRLVPPIPCPHCGLIAHTVFCHECCSFKLPRSVPSFAHEIDTDLQIDAPELRRAA